MNSRHLSRRQILAGVGSVGLALPFLPSLLPRAARADTVKPPKRFICVCHEYGHNVLDFFPSTDPTIRLDDNTFYMKLSDLNGDISTILNSKFDPYRAQMNVYHGLDTIGGGGHNSTVPLTGAGYQNDADGEDSPPVAGRSIDVLMAKSASVYPLLPRFPAIRISNAYYGFPGVSWDKDASNTYVRIPYIGGDVDVLNAIFGNVNLDDAAAQAAARHRTLVDKVMGRYTALRGNSRLGTLDRQRLDAHVQNVADLEKRLAQSVSCSKPTFTPYSDTTPREVLWHNQIDSLMAAMACDMTRVGVLHVHDYKFGTDPQDYSESHGNSHGREDDPAGRAAGVQFSAFKADQVLYLLQKLANTTEADGTSMLDNTVVLWTAELSNGNYHTASDLPLATFGSCGGALKTGYYMDFRLKPLQYIAGRSDFHTPLGQAYNRLLITLMRAMGMPESEYINEGDGGGFGAFNQNIQYIDNQYTQFISQRNTPLPIVFG